MKLTFRLTVADVADATCVLDPDSTDTTATGHPDNCSTRNLTKARVSTDMVTITVVSASDVAADELFYSGLTITSASFCKNLSLGGPALVAADKKWNSTNVEYPPDVLASDKDNIADTCVLPSTRRAAVAERNALHQLANLYPTDFSNELHKAKGPCATAQGSVEAASAVLEAYGNISADSADALAADSCGNGKKGVNPTSIAYPGDLGRFYSGTVVGGIWDGAPINGPSACTNFGLGGGVGGTWLHAADLKDNETGEAYPQGTGMSARDGIADSCVLPFTLREAVARQSALAALKKWDAAKATDDDDATVSLYGNLLKQACRELAGTHFAGDKPIDLAQDSCVKTPAGTPLP